MKMTIKRGSKQVRIFWPDVRKLRDAGAKMKTIITLSGCAALLWMACDVKDPIFNTSHPERGAIALTADWSRIGEGLDIPASYTVRIGDYTTTVSGTTNTIDHLFEPGTYRMLICNTPENIRIDGTVAGAVSGDRHVPGWLFSYAGEVTVAKDADHAVTAVMQQQVRQLTLVVEPTGQTTGKIKSIGGSISSIAGKLDMENGSYSGPMLMPLYFSKITEGADAGKWTITLRVLGFIPEEKHKLTLEIKFKDDNPKPVTIESDLSVALAGFNDDKRTPLTLGGTLVQTPTEVGFAATITGWNDGGSINGDATVE